MNTQMKIDSQGVCDGRGHRRSGSIGTGHGLLALNVVLLVGLGLVSFAPFAGAQGGVGQSSRALGEYLVVGGATIGGVSSTIYVLDTANRELIALGWNNSTKSLEGVGYRDLSQDSSSDPDR